MGLKSIFYRFGGIRVRRCAVGGIFLICGIGPGGYSLRYCVVLRRVTNHIRSNITTLFLIVLLEFYRLRLVWNLHGTKFIVHSGKL